MSKKDLNSISSIPMVVIKNTVIFPQTIVPIFLSEKEFIHATNESINTHGKIFLTTYTNEDCSSNNKDQFITQATYNIGTVCTILRKRELFDGRIKVLLQGLHKASLLETSDYNNYKLAKINPIEEVVFNKQSPELDAMIKAIRENIEKLTYLGKIFSPDLLIVLEDVKDPGHLADLVSINLSLQVESSQYLLTLNDPIARLGKVYSILCKEIEKLEEQARNSYEEDFRNEQLKYTIGMRNMYNEDQDTKDDLDVFWKKLENPLVPHHVVEEMTKQLKRLAKMHQDSSEAVMTRTHIENVLNLPWGTYTHDRLCLLEAKNILNKDHYSLSTVKDRILEYLAVKKLNPNAKSPIICFVGPPGVGKTSLGQSIAASMGRKFSRISLGGVRDEADIRGHRKTYVGAYCGRIIQAIKNVDSFNPVIMLDEIDKLGMDQRGDPASALLEVLDPEQNHNFVDHYLNIPCDLSKIMFIANANNISTIPSALRDRLEIIDVSGYTEDEKVVIAKKYLVPKQIKEAGLNQTSFKLNKEALTTLISRYTRESGLRNLERKIATLCRKAARQIAENKASKILLTSKRIVKYLGVPSYESMSYTTNAEVGVSLALAYTSQGGEILAIESNITNNKSGTKLILTGQLGDVMKESAQTALGFLKSNIYKLGMNPEIIENKDIHIHMPQGAIPKDGPSAGIALTSSILSALLKQPFKQASCMTGEITLHGRVLAIGGLKEKILAAQREGIKTILIPKANRQNYDLLASNFSKQQNIFFVEHYFEVFQLLFNLKSHNTKTSAETFSYDNSKLVS